MSEKTIERKFTSRFDGKTQFVSDYGDLKDLNVGMWPIFLFKDSNEMKFQAFFEGRELTPPGKIQKVFLQYDLKINEGGIKTDEPKVAEYNFPLTGKIKEQDMKKYFIKYHPVNN